MVRIATSRINTKDPDALDTTVKSASTPEGKAFAPTWGMVKSYKDQTINYDWDDYVQDYMQLVRKRYAQDMSTFLNILNRERVVITCYCRAGHNCHRLLAVEILKKIASHHGIEVIEEGEV